MLESAEAGKGFGTEFGYGGQHAAYRFFLHIARLGEEFIRVLIKKTKDGIYTDKGFVPFCDIEYIDIIGEVKE